MDRSCWWTSPSTSDGESTSRNSSTITLQPNQTSSVTSLTRGPRCHQEPEEQQGHQSRWDPSSDPKRRWNSCAARRSGERENSAQSSGMLWSWPYLRRGIKLIVETAEVSHSCQQRAKYLLVFSLTAYCQILRKFSQNHSTASIYLEVQQIWSSQPANSRKNAGNTRSLCTWLS